MTESYSPASASWRSRLAEKGLVRFEHFWDLEQDWFEEPNTDGTGWSGVSRHDVDDGRDPPFAVFVKRQQDYFMDRRWARWLGLGSLWFEARNLRRCEALDIPVPPLLFAGARRHQGHRQSVLVLLALDGYQPLDSVMADWLTGGVALADQRRAVAAIAAVIARLHDARLSFNALYPKHIFVHTGWLRGRATDQPPVRLIDLERVKRRLTRAACARVDLEKLNRHCLSLRASLRLAFYRAYRGITRLGPEDKQFLRDILAKSARKRRGR